MTVSMTWSTELMHAWVGPLPSRSVVTSYTAHPTLAMPMQSRHPPAPHICRDQPMAVACPLPAPRPYAQGAAMGAEQRGKGTNVMLGPDVNLARVPWSGRVFETMGEDPYLASALVGPLVQLLQHHPPRLAPSLVSLASTNAGTSAMPRGRLHPAARC